MPEELVILGRHEYHEHSMPHALEGCAPEGKVAAIAWLGIEFLRRATHVVVTAKWIA